MIAVLNTMAPAAPAFHASSGNLEPETNGLLANAGGFSQLLALGDAVAREGDVSDRNPADAATPEKPQLPEDTDTELTAEPPISDDVLWQPILQVPADDSAAPVETPPQVAKASVLRAGGSAATPAQSNPSIAQLAFVETNASAASFPQYSSAAQQIALPFGKLEDFKGGVTAPQSASVDLNDRITAEMLAVQPAAPLIKLTSDTAILQQDHVVAETPIRAGLAQTPAPKLIDPDKVSRQTDGADYAIPKAAEPAPVSGFIRLTPDKPDAKPTQPDVPKLLMETPIRHASDDRPTLVPHLSTFENAWRQKWQAADPTPASAKPGNLSDAITSDRSAARSIEPKPASSVLSVAFSDAGTLAGEFPGDAIVLAVPPKSTAITIAVVANPAWAGSLNPADLPDIDGLLPEMLALEKPAAEASDVGAPSLLPFNQVATPNALQPGATAPPLPAALAPAIVQMAKTGIDGPLELALSPEELGRLTISIQQDGDFVRVTMIAERPETLDLLRRHASDLVADLRQSGFSGASLSFGQGGQGQSELFTVAKIPIDENQTPQSPLHETKQPAPSRVTKGSGLDLRL